MWCAYDHRAYEALHAFLSFCVFTPHNLSRSFQTFNYNDMVMAYIIIISDIINTLCTQYINGNNL